MKTGIATKGGSVGIAAATAFSLPKSVGAIYGLAYASAAVTLSHLHAHRSPHRALSLSFL